MIVELISAYQQNLTKSDAKNLYKMEFISLEEMNKILREIKRNRKNK